MSQYLAFQGQIFALVAAVPHHDRSTGPSRRAFDARSSGSAKLRCALTPSGLNARETGTNGGVSAVGTLASALGGLSVGAVLALAAPGGASLSSLVACGACGLLAGAGGSLIDSVTTPPPSALPRRSCEQRPARSRAPLRRIRWRKRSSRRRLRAAHRLAAARCRRRRQRELAPLRAGSGRNFAVLRARPGRARCQPSVRRTGPSRVPRSSSGTVRAARSVPPVAPSPAPPPRGRVKPPGRGRRVAGVARICGADVLDNHQVPRSPFVRSSCSAPRHVRGRGHRPRPAHNPLEPLSPPLRSQPPAPPVQGQPALVDSHCAAPRRVLLVRRAQPHQ